MIPTQLIKLIKEPLKKNRLFLNAETRIVFTCGGANADRLSARQKVLNYAQKQFPEFLFFQAEDAFSQLTPQRNKDLLTLEVSMLAYADCVMIILESVGAIAELGAFSVNDSVAKTILLINDKRYENEKSFLQMGPVAKVSLVSDFKPPIYTNLDQILRSAAQIKERLDRIPKIRRKRVQYESLAQLQANDPKARLFLLLDMLAIFSPIAKIELQQMWHDIFNDTANLEFDIAMLKALHFISVQSGYILRLHQKPAYFFSFYTTNLDSVRSRVLLHYFRKEPRRIQLMESVMM